MLLRQTGSDFSEEHWEILEPDGDGTIQLVEAIGSLIHYDPCRNEWERIDRERSRSKYRLQHYGYDCLPPGTDDSEVEETKSWPKLDPQHEQSLREFTRKQYRRFSFINPEWHPVVREEALRIDDGF